MRQSAIRKSFLIYLVLLATLCSFQAVPRLLFTRHRDAIRQLLKQWLDAGPPPGIDPIRWEDVSFIAEIGIGNVCFSETFVSLKEMDRLENDLREKVREPATLDSVRWFWGRLAETGPKGKEYIEQMKPLLAEAIGKDAAAEP